ncbi:hypothetical protein GCM10009552_00320 [Rothia nasimurium]
MSVVDDTEGYIAMHVPPAPEIPGTPSPEPDEKPVPVTPETPGDDPAGPTPQAPPRHPDDPEDGHLPPPATPEALAIRIP